MSLSSLTSLDNVGAGATLATVTGRTPGSTLSISPGDGRFVLNVNGTAVLRGLTAWTDGPVTLTITESKFGFVTSVNTFTFTVTPPVAIPVITPSTNYNGTQLSGGTPPTDPLRIGQSGGKPAMGWIYGYRGQVVAGTDMLMAVEAECVGGVKYVDIWFEGTTQRVQRTKQSVYDSSTGLYENRVAYWFYLRVPAGQRGAGYVARVFATATPNDNTMQPRTLGWQDGTLNSNIVPADTSVTGYRAPVDSGESGAWMPFWVFPRPNQFDAVKHVKADGTGDYTTFGACRDALMSAIYAGTAEHWDIVLHDANNELGIPSTFVNASGGAGGAPASRVRAASGVSARLYHNSTWDPYNTPVTRNGQFGSTVTIPSWDAFLGVNNWEFYGGANGTTPDGQAHGALRIDHANFNNLMTQAQDATFVLNGAKITNSAMTSNDMFHVYGNGLPGGIVTSHPGIGPGPMYLQNPSRVCVSLIDSVQEYVTFGYGALQDYRSKRVNGLSNPHDNCHVIVENYTCGFDGTYLIANKEAMRVGYTGTGTVAVMHFAAETTQTGTPTFSLVVDGTTVGSISIINPGFYTDPVIGTAATGCSAATMQQLVNWIAAQPNFTATWTSGGLGANFCAYTLMRTNYYQNPYDSPNLKAGNIPLYSTIDSHNEWMHILSFGGGAENFLCLRCIETQSHWSTGHFHIEVNDANNGTNLARDIIIASFLSFATNQSWQQLTGTGGPANLNRTRLIGDHTAAIDCTSDNGLLIEDNSSTQKIGPRTGMLRNIWDYVQYDSAPWQTTTIVQVQNNAHVNGGANPPYATTDFIWSTFNALFNGVTASVASADFRPNASGQLAAHKAARAASLQCYDVLGNLYDTVNPDYIGALAGAASAVPVVYPTFSDATFPV